jgi:hypothetical protein
MQKIDLVKGDLKDAYRATAKPALVTVPKITYLSIDGQGDPNGIDFQQAVEALYSVAYTLKFMVKQGGTKLNSVDYKVAPLEAQWFMPDMTKFNEDNKDRWQWTAMIATPDFITSSVVSGAIDRAKLKKPLNRLADVQLVTQSDGLSAQVLYVGPYADEGPTIKRLHEFIKESGCRLHGRHREIYLGDPRRSAPDKLKTIIRQPCRRAKTSSSR